MASNSYAYFQMLHEKIKFIVVISEKYWIQPLSFSNYVKSFSALFLNLYLNSKVDNHIIQS